MIDDLHVRFETKLGTVRAVNGVSLNVRQGGVLGLVGESGCGKSITAFTVMQLVAPRGRSPRTSPDAYDYWFAMANQSFLTLELPEALWFSADRDLKRR